MENEITAIDLDRARKALDVYVEQLRQFAGMTTVSEGDYGGRLLTEAMHCELLSAKLERMYWEGE